MSVKKDIKEIKEKINYLYDSKLISKAKKYDELARKISNIKFDSVDVKKTYDYEGRIIKKFLYKLEIDLEVDENGDVIPNEMFKSINELNLLRLEDLLSLNEKIKK